MKTLIFTILIILFVGCDLEKQQIEYNPQKPEEAKALSGEAASHKKYFLDNYYKLNDVKEVFSFETYSKHEGRFVITNRQDKNGNTLCFFEVVDHTNYAIGSFFFECEEGIDQGNKILTASKARIGCKYFDEISPFKVEQLTIVETNQDLKLKIEYKPEELDMFVDSDGNVRAGFEEAYQRNIDQIELRKNLKVHYNNTDILKTNTDTITDSINYDKCY